METSTYTVVIDGDDADPAHPPMTVHNARCPDVDGSQDWAVTVPDLVTLARELFGYTGDGHDPWMHAFTEDVTVMPCTRLPTYVGQLRITEAPVPWSPWTVISRCRRQLPLTPGVAAFIARMYANPLDSADILGRLAEGRSVHRTDVAEAIGRSRTRYTHPDDRVVLDALAAYVAEA